MSQILSLVLFACLDIAVRAVPAKILAQIQNVPGIPALEIYAQEKGKDTVNDAVPNFFALYQSLSTVGSLLKETHTGKLVSEWQKLVDDAAQKPEVVEMAPAISSMMAVKDAEELVSRPHRCIQRCLS